MAEVQGDSELTGRRSSLVVEIMMHGLKKTNYSNSPPILEFWGGVVVDSLVILFDFSANQNQFNFPN